MCSIVLVFMIKIHYSSHFIFLSTTTAPTLALNILWFCDTGHANCNTGSVAHDFQQLPVTKDTVAEKNFALRCSEQTPWRSYGKETTQTGTLRPEKRHTANSTVLTPAGQKHHSGWKEFCPPLVRKDTVANPLRRYHDSKAPCDIVYRIGLGSRNAVAVRKLTHRRPRFSAIHCSKMNRSHGPEVDMFSINMPRHAHKQSAQRICS